MKNSTPELFRHRFPVEIRFVDMDAFGHVNNAHYLTYFEQARVRYFNDVVDWPYDWSKQGIILARAEINFEVPARFGDEAVIFTRCSRIGNKSFDLEYRMTKMKEGKEVLLADGMTVMVAFDYVSNHPIVVPDEWKAALQKFEGTSL